jgi:predicted dehydrogenase
LIEKPLSLSAKEAEELVLIAEKKKKILMIGHTFLYNPAIRKMKKYIEEGKVGAIYYMHATRTHLGLVREDVSSVWDLAPHDVSIFNYLIDSMPKYVSALGGNFLQKGKEDVAFITLKYPDGVLANIHVSWADSNKVREVQVVGSKARMVFNDLDNLEKLKIFKKGIFIDKPYNDFGEFQYVLRDGDIISPKIDLLEPLKEQCKHFIGCVTKRKRPLTDGRNGLDVVRVMQAIHASLKNNGHMERV